MRPWHRGSVGPASTRLAVRYGAGLALAHLLTVAEVIAVGASLGIQARTDSAPVDMRDVIALVAVVAAGTAAAAAGGYLSIAGAVPWFTAGREPEPGERRAAMHLIRRQAAILLTIWVLSGVTLIALGSGTSSDVTTLIGLAVLFGGTATLSTSMLFTQRIYRPIIAAATRGYVGRETTPGVLARLAMMWVTTSALPSAAIVVLVTARHYGWIIPRTASLDIPVVVLALVAVLVGLRALILVSRSISDPLHDVIEAMADVERGRIGRTVEVYEQSEIGRLQRGFNSMVAGLGERDRLRDLFGRHVGADVVRLAVAADESLSGEVRDVAILFVDLAGSTQLAARRPPEEVAAVLNDFFRIVVAAVDRHHGSINKFQGDAALAVFGAPLRAERSASVAMATARALGADLRGLPAVDFGIGVSAGAVFAGNIGAENRYEYTVIGDPVNEAARLADTAKSTPGRVLCSGAAAARADEDERRCWTAQGSVLLRGRTDPTLISSPK